MASLKAEFSRRQAMLSFGGSREGVHKMQRLLIAALIVASLLLGKAVWQSELCEVEDSWCGDTQIVGVPTYDRELPIDEWVERHNKLAELAKRVYRQVMREEPKDGPYLMSWTQVS